MTSPHEREERDFFDDLSDGAPPQNQAEPLPRNGDGDDPTEEPQAASDPRAAQTEMIRIADHLPPGVGRAGTPTGWRPLGAAALCAAPRPGPGGTGIPAAITRAAPRRPAAENSNGARQFERPQFAPPPPFSSGGGRHGTPDRGERDSRGADPWGQAPQRWQEPPNHGAGRRGEPRSGDELRDKLRATDLIAPRKIESSSGWRKAALRRLRRLDQCRGVR